MEIGNCVICSIPSKSVCSACKKVAYCSKDHQKEDRKNHKPDCFPAYLKSHPVYGHHLVASKDLLPGEKIFKEEPLILGPRSNLSQFNKICLGCLNKIPDSTKTNILCSNCKWPLCSKQCQQNPKHVHFECPILTSANVPPATTQDEYLCITFLRCVLLEKVDPPKWAELLKFESHVEARKTRPISIEQSQFAIYFIREKCGLSSIDPKIIDFIYGTIIVNGYGDPSTFTVKLYSKAAKLSHACIPNTRTLLSSQSGSLEVLATVAIPTGTPLTQLYGRIFKGTHKRQELLQNIYYFSCSCPRCKDPTELGSYFSAIKCTSKKCLKGYLLPRNPLDISNTSKWNCDQKKCSNSLNFSKCVLPALEEIHKTAGTDENEGLYSEYEAYDEDNPDLLAIGDHVFAFKLSHVEQMGRILRRLEKDIVHPNHYALLPLKTALIASSYKLLKDINLKSKDNKALAQELLADYLRMVKEMLEVVEILLPGMTAERGLLLFYLSEGMRISFQEAKLSDSIMAKEMQSRLKLLQEESLKIMKLDSEDDDHRKLVEANIPQ